LKTETETALTDPLEITEAVRRAKRAYPDAEIRVRRGRVIVVDDELIRLISVRMED
jgi:hypothetical protein